MKNKILISLLFMSFISTTVFSQFADRKNGLSYRYSGINHQFPLDSKKIGNLDHCTSGAEIAYWRYLNNFLDLVVPFKLGTARFPISKEKTTNSRMLSSLDATLHLKYAKEGQLLNPYLLAGVGAMVEAGNKFNVEFPVGLGLNVRIVDNVYFNIQSEYRIDLTEYRTNLQNSFGLVFLLGKGKPDTDKDGISDDQDRCPNAYGSKELMGCPDRDNDGVADKDDACPDKVGPVASGGCPDTDGDGLTDNKDKCPEEKGPKANMGCPYADTDGDGIIDKDDKCPTLKGPKLTMGCPDTDGDGLTDNVDQCPEQKGPKANNGCPVTDKDGDGVADSEDACPNVKGLKKFNGCPDTDGDGVQDKMDKCPKVAGLASNQGCPAIKKEDQKVLNFAMHAVEFETGSSTLKNVSYSVLNKIVEIMNRYPNYNLRINGYTDSVGHASANQKLSERRAKACFDYLASKGIELMRMTYVGYGEANPIGDNKTKDGRRQNRRVEFDLYLK